MRNVPGRRVPVNGRTVYVEESGHGDAWVVFEAGGGCGRTCWDPVLPELSAEARLVAYDRAPFASVEEMADDLVAMTEAVVPSAFVLVAHSMGGLVARRAAERLGPRLRGLLMVDTLPETSPVYDTWAETTRKVDRALALSQALSHWRPLARLFSANVRRVYPAETYEVMLAEDFTPAGVAETRAEVAAVAAAVPRFRTDPPPLPACPAIVLSAARPARGRERQHAAMVPHQRQYASSLPDGRWESVDAGHLIQAERPDVIAARVRELLSAAR